MFIAEVLPSIHISCCMLLMLEPPCSHAGPDSLNFVMRFALQACLVSIYRFGRELLKIGKTQHNEGTW